MLNHEADVVVLRNSGYAIEIEIKVSLSDIKRDLKKGHDHSNVKLKELYFAIPDELYEKAVEFIPEHAGIFCFRLKNLYRSNKKKGEIQLIRKAKENRKARKVNDRERLELLRLAYLRMWSLKSRVHFEESDII